MLPFVTITISSLQEQQVILEQFIKDKDDYIHHCNALTNDYRLRALDNDNRFQRLVQSHATVQQSVDDQKQTISSLNDNLSRYIII